MTQDWKAYWDRHAVRAEGADPLSRVQRTIASRPVSAESFAAFTAHLLAQLDPQPGHEVLDLCCGNGLLSAALEPVSARVTAVDFCPALLAEVPARTTGRTQMVLGDARTVEFRPRSFDRVLLAAALQHFEPPETVGLFCRVVRFLRPDGVFLLTDIPDADRRWAFFDRAERERAYFESVEAGAPLLGAWYDREWLGRLARYAGFVEAVTIDQPIGLPFAHYRFDLRCRT